MGWMVAVAQLVRARDCDSRGRGFETRQPPFGLVLQAWSCRFRAVFSLLAFLVPAF